MSEDARFEDGAERPLRLKALEPDDLSVIAALTQDAVFPVTEMAWDRARRRFSILLNRFRWEDNPEAGQRERDFERVQSVLSVEDVMAVKSQGIDRTDRELVLSLLTLEFKASEDGAGRIELTLAGDGAIALDVEALEVTLRDVTRPYAAPSGKAPGHPE